MFIKRIKKWWNKFVKGIPEISDDLIFDIRSVMPDKVEKEKSNDKS